DGDLAAPAGEEVGGGGRGEVAVLVHDDAAGTGAGLSREDIGRRRHVGQVHAGDRRHARHGTRGHDNRLGVELEYVGHVGWRVEANVDPGLPNLADEPVSDGGI